jgi:hypothetical protein
VQVREVPELMKPCLKATECRQETRIQREALAFVFCWCIQLKMDETQHPSQGLLAL